MKYYKLVLNAEKPKGFWGKMMIRSMNKNHYDITTWGLSHFNFNENQTALDVGCGGGITVNRISKKVSKVYGIDYSSLAVEKSKKYNKKEIKKGKVEIQQASVSNLPFSDNTFDIVTAIETFYFWSDKTNDLKEIKRVLKPNGTLLMIFEMCKNEQDPDKWQEVENLAKIKAPTENEIINFLSDAGYVNIKTDLIAEKSWLVATGEKE